MSMQRLKITRWGKEPQQHPELTRTFAPGLLDVNAEAENHSLGQCLVDIYYNEVQYSKGSAGNIIINENHCVKGRNIGIYTTDG